jgi:hypothetical protein
MSTLVHFQEMLVTLQRPEAKKEVKNTGATVTDRKG